MNKNKRISPALLLNPIHFLSLGFGSGLSPWAPGTMGTVVAIPVYLLFINLGSMQYFFLTLFLFVVGIALCAATAKRLNVHDHPGIVWDEIVGYLLTMMAVPTGWVWIIVGFVLFRLFDIWKPWPIRYLDQRVPGGLGIMLDDVLAAVYASLVLQAIIYLSDGGNVFL